nr:AI-2E family transporter [uncultured Albidiferax sp.]
MPHPPKLPPSLTPPRAAPEAAGHTYKMLFAIAVLTVLYVGREVLIPVTLAVVLSLAIAPAVRALKRLGLGQVPAVLSAVVALSLLLLGLATLIGMQAVELADSLPQYQSTLGAKIEILREATVGRVESMQGSAGRIFGKLIDAGSGVESRAGELGAGLHLPPGVVPVQIQERPATALQLASQVLGSLWGPLGTVGVVLIVLVFVLLEHESLRDRFIHLTGGTDIRTATYAFNDAGQRLSRFFVSQFAVNLGVGAIIGLGLACIGVPHGVFFGVITAVLRFVPYVGVAAAAVGAAVLGAAVETGWTTMFLTIGLFAVVEVVVAQVVEPQLYGHSTGLSPLSVVLSAIFWGWIWGPMGLLVSTPLTLCLVVAGRHVKSLAFLDVLLGETSPLSLSEKFYQRALSDDAGDIIAAARQFLKKRSFAKYCDQILMPALRLGAVDLAAGSINAQQQQKLRHAIVQAIESLGAQAGAPNSRRRRAPVLDDPNIGLQLRRLRESQLGPWQGPLSVPPGSITLCLGASSLRNDLVTEILARVLRQQRVDARSFSVEDLDTPAPPGAVPESVAIVFIVISLMDAEKEACTPLVAKVRTLFPQATVVGLLSLHAEQDEQAWTDIGLDLTVDSFEQAAQYASARYASAAHPDSATAKSTD